MLGTNALDSRAYSNDRRVGDFKFFDQTGQNKDILASKRVTRCLEGRNIFKSNCEGRQEKGKKI
jgi:hypothetical protein